MCGRYVRKSDKQKIADAFHLAKVPDVVMAPSDYNVAPTTFQPIVRQSKESPDELADLLLELV